MWYYILVITEFVCSTFFLFFSFMRLQYLWKVVWRRSNWDLLEFGLWRVQEKMAKRELILVQSTTRMQHNHSLEWSAGGKFGGRHYLSPWKLETSLSLYHLSNKTSIYFNKEQVAYNACLNSWIFLPIWLFRLSHRLQLDIIALTKTMLKLTD